MTRPGRIVLGIGTLLLAAALAGCSGGDRSTGRQLTQRQRDSTLGRSVIPGSSTVTRALQVSDRAAAAAAARNAEVEAETP